VSILRGVSTRDVLLVDDDPRFRAVARSLLPAWGFEVSGAAANGREALDTATRLRPSIVLLDIQMPDIDGFEVTRRLLATAPPPAVVLISTREAIDYGRRIGDSGALGFITKSRLSEDTLRALLRGALDVQR
jgi:DNA-binding NarL/FixJ family response regulator